MEWKCAKSFIYQRHRDKMHILDKKILSMNLQTNKFQIYNVLNSVIICRGQRKNCTIQSCKKLFWIQIYLFSMWLQPPFINVCFWYVPQNMRSLPEGKERDEKLASVSLIGSSISHHLKLSWDPINLMPQMHWNLWDTTCQVQVRLPTVKCKLTSFLI